MKKSLLFSAVLAGLMLGSCSSSDDIAGTSEKFSADGKGYVNVTLNLPTQPQSTSRAKNDEFDHGVADEYKVNDATLILFVGADEATATFKAAYKLDGWKKDLTPSAQISTTLSKVQKINVISASSTDKIYAFVVLNNNGALKVTPTNTLKVHENDFTGTFADLSKEDINTFLKKDNLMMSNAVIISKPGSADFSSVKATTLTDVTDKIYKTESEATSHPAANIYVERLAAKVTLENATGTSKNKVSVGSGTAKTFAYSLEGWRLANVNTSSYLTRQYDNTWNGYKSDATDFTVTSHTDYDNNAYRFAGIKAIDTGMGYRTYWGKDANYDVLPNFTDGNDEPTLAGGASTYCYENTFNVAHQNVKETTCAIVKMKITPEGYSDGTFFTIDDNKGVVYSIDDVKTEIGKRFLAEIGDANVKANYYPTTTATINVKDVEFADAAGEVTITKMTLTDGTTDKEVTAADLTTFKPTIKVNEFKDGYAYYTILIKHFGDELTPWNPSTKTTLSYPDTNKEENWLGRYGVLRNNWYKLDVTGVAAIGASTPGELNVNNDDTPDDNLKRYISCKINALSWAVRKQGTILQ
mgnify:FL=1